MAELDEGTGSGRAYFDDFKEYKVTDKWVEDDDERHPQWDSQRAIYGFDSRQTWSLNTTMLELLYERLMMFVEKADQVVDLTFHNFEHRGETFTQLELIEKMIGLIKYALDDDGDSMDEGADAISETWEIWALVHRSMWW